MNYLSNPIFNVLSKIRWNFHLVFTFPDIYQRNTSLNAIRLRKDTFYNFISRFMHGNIVEIGGGHNSMSRFFKNIKNLY